MVVIPGVLQVPTYCIFCHLLWPSRAAFFLAQQKTQKNNINFVQGKAFLESHQSKPLDQPVIHYPLVANIGCVFLCVYAPCFMPP